jgi:penicillin-binding protein 1C
LGPGRLYGRLSSWVRPPCCPKGPSRRSPWRSAGSVCGCRIWPCSTPALARGGDAVRLHGRRQAAEPRGELPPPQRLLTPVAAWYVTDILRHAPAPANARAGQIAYKTRNLLRISRCLGRRLRRSPYRCRLGRPARRHGHSRPCRTGAGGPLLFDAFARLSPAAHAIAAARARALRLATAELPPPCSASGNAEEQDAGAYLDPPVQIAFPPDRAELAFEDIDRGWDRTSKPRVAPCRCCGCGTACLWPRTRPNARRSVGQWPGVLHLTVIDAKGRDDRCDRAHKVSLPATTAKHRPYR